MVTIVTLGSGLFYLYKLKYPQMAKRWKKPIALKNYCQPLLYTDYYALYKSHYEDKEQLTGYDFRQILDILGIRGFCFTGEDSATCTIEDEGVLNIVICLDTTLYISNINSGTSGIYLEKLKNEDLLKQMDTTLNPAALVPYPTSSSSESDIPSPAYEPNVPLSESIVNEVASDHENSNNSMSSLADASLNDLTLPLSNPEPSLPDGAQVSPIIQEVQPDPANSNNSTPSLADGPLNDLTLPNNEPSPNPDIVKLSRGTSPMFDESDESDYEERDYNLEFCFTLSQNSIIFTKKRELLDQI